MRASIALTALLALSLLISPAIAAPNTTPKPGQITCKCTCALGKQSKDLSYAWDKTRAECQALSGSSCTYKRDDGSIATGYAKGCCTILSKPVPKPSDHLEEELLMAP